MITNKIFTPDELRIILKWALDWHNWPEIDATIGGDTMFEKELDALKGKLKDAVPEIVLGGLNTCFLLGFDVLDSPYPLQQAWDGLTQLHRCAIGSEGEHVETLRKFLEGACLIERTKRDEQSEPIYC